MTLSCLSVARILTTKYPVLLKLWRPLRGFDVVVLLGYLFVLHKDAARLALPSMNSGIINDSYFLFLSSFLLALGTLFFVKNHWLKSAGSEKNRYTDFGSILCIVGLLSGIPIVISIVVSLIEHFNLFLVGGNFGLRAISTSLHRLVPFESRWIYLIGFPIILVGVTEEKLRWAKYINLGILIFLLSVTQTKINYLVLFAVIIIWFFTQSQYSFKKAILYASSFTIIGVLSLNHVVSEASRNVASLLTNKSNFAIEENNWEKTNNTTACQGFPTAVNAPAQLDQPSQSPVPTKPTSESPRNPQSLLPPQPQHQAQLQPQLQPQQQQPQNAFLKKVSTLSFLRSRLFNISARVTRVFYCLRSEAGWQPEFRGHQMFRFVGGYKPVYRWIMNSVDKQHGATAVTSAVANVVADSFLNGGFIGVGISAALAAVFWGFLFFLSANPLFFYLRMIYCSILCTQGIITAGVVVVFVLLMFLISEVWSRSRFRMT